MPGKIVTFYSWKGGVGRSMALANVGVQLARRGKNVLLVDWDLEAPGLDRYFHRVNGAHWNPVEIIPAPDNSGLLGLLSDRASNPSKPLSDSAWKTRCTEVRISTETQAKPSSSAHIERKSLKLLSSGFRFDGYASQLQAFSWVSFFAHQGGAPWLEELREQWRNSFDMVLIDSRTGLTDGGGVCTIQMPDILVFVFTANKQCLEDGLDFLAAAERARAGFEFERVPLTIVPLLARWEGEKEVDEAEKWLKQMEPLAAPMVGSWFPKDMPIRRMLERLRVPHVARFSFGEPLPVLTHSTSDPSLPGLSYDLLSELLADGFANAGRIIEPSYQPPFDPEHSTEPEVERLVLNDSIRKVEIAKIREEKGGDSSELAAALLRLAEGALRVGKLELARELADKAIPLIRRRIESNSSVPFGKQVLIRALKCKGEILERQFIALTGASRRDEALLVARGAVDISRELAMARPEEFLPGLATSLSNLGNRLSDLDRREEALEASREAVEIRRRLAQARPDAFLPDLAKSLNNLGIRLSDLGHCQEALEASREAAVICRQIAQARPDAFLPDLAMSLKNLGKVLSNLGHREEALEATREAAVIYRQLAQARPDAILPYLARSLGAHGTILLRSARPADAAATFGEALGITLTLTRKLPSAHRGLATALANDYRSACQAAGLNPDPQLLSDARSLGIELS